MIRVLVVGSSNPDKATEIAEIFRSLNIKVKTLSDFKNMPEIEEDRNTLEGNALKKALSIYEYIGLPVISDDTGLEVDALNGAPGVFSARFAGAKATYQENVKKILHDLKIVPYKQRTARFRTVAVYYDGTNKIITEGLVEGHITTEPRGNYGFGYDPIFETLETKQTFAEMTGSAKNAISHRGRALRKLFFELQQHKVLS